MARQAAKPKRRRYRRSTPGAPPGTFVVDPEAPPTLVRVIAYGPDGFLDQPVEDLRSLAGLQRTWPVVWVNVDGLGDEKLLREIGEIFGLHPLALADVTNVPQRAKVEQYGRQVFVVTRMAHAGEELETEQLSLFLGEGFVLTFQERPGDCLDPIRERIRKGTAKVRAAGADYLAYAVIDAVIDNCFPVLEQYGERIEALEDRVIADPDARLVGQIHAAKRDLLNLRRAVWPQREALNWLLREQFPLITEDTRLYLRDCYDHAAQIIDILETYRELASGLLEAYMSSLSNRMNEVMKVLTIIATIFIPLSFVAGLYGMNFNPDKSPWNMPELSWRLGYPFALALMAVVAAGMLVYFRRKGWLGGSPDARRAPTGQE